jgi:hypothetical protein
VPLERAVLWEWRCTLNADGGVSGDAAVYSCVRYDQWLKDAMLNNATISNQTLRTLECDPHLFDEVAHLLTPRGCACSHRSPPCPPSSQHQPSTRSARRARRGSSSAPPACVARSTSTDIKLEALITTRELDRDSLGSCYGECGKQRRRPCATLRQRHERPPFGKRDEPLNERDEWPSPKGSESRDRQRQWRRRETVADTTHQISALAPEAVGWAGARTLCWGAVLSPALH